MILRKKRLFLVLILVICILVASISLVTLKMSHTFTIDSRQVAIETLPEDFIGFKIGFFSDLDIKDSKDIQYIDKCVNQINSQNCDLIIFGGDLFEDGHIFDEESLITILKSIKAPYGKFAILGENEFKNELEKSIILLEKCGFQVLRNQATPIYYKNSQLCLAGLESNGNIDQILTDEQKNQTVIAAIHQPDYFNELSNQSINIQLSGHTGGGFIRLPFFGAIQKIDGGQTFYYNTYSQNGKSLYISNGIGLGHNQSFRLFTNPNALVLTLSKRQETLSSSEA